MVQKLLQFFWIGWWRCIVKGLLTTGLPSLVHWSQRAYWSWKPFEPRWAKHIDKTHKTFLMLIFWHRQNFRYAIYAQNNLKINSKSAHKMGENHAKIRKILFQNFGKLLFCFIAVFLQTKGTQALAEMGLREVLAHTFFSEIMSK